VHWFAFDICLEDGSMAVDRVPAKSAAEAEQTVLRIYPGARWATLRGTNFANTANRPRPPRDPDLDPPAATGPDPYQVLGIPNHADPQAVKDAWRKALRVFHPDRVAGQGPEMIALAERKTRELNAAYEAIRRQQ